MFWFNLIDLGFLWSIFIFLFNFVVGKWGVWKINCFEYVIVFLNLKDCFIIVCCFFLESYGWFIYMDWVISICLMVLN